MSLITLFAALALGIAMKKQRKAWQVCLLKSVRMANIKRSGKATGQLLIEGRLDAFARAAEKGLIA